MVARVTDSRVDASSSTAQRWAIDFAIHGDSRFLSHRDMLRSFARAVGRARLPIRFSEGFNPRPRMSLPLPRPVGVASDVERLVVDLTEEIDSEVLLTRLAQQMPSGVDLRTALLLESREQCVPVRVVYVVEPIAEERATLEQRITRLMNMETLEVERVRPKRGKPRLLNIRPFVDSMETTPTGVRMCLLVTHDGTARAVELCEALGLDSDTPNHRILRTEIEWQ